MHLSSDQMSEAFIEYLDEQQDDYLDYDFEASSEEPDMTRQQEE